jgi:hypothetical protein
MLRHWSWRVAVASLVLMLQGCASVVKAPCDSVRPSQWMAPTVYLIKFPFVMNDPESPVQQRIDALLDLQAIAISSNLGQSNLTLLESTSRDGCDVSEVFDAVTSSNAGIFGRRLYRSAVFVWGEVFEEKNTVYTQTFVRVFWNARDATVAVSVKTSAEDRPLKFTGQFPSATIAFPPQKISRDVLRKLERAGEELEPRASPDSDGAPVPLPKRFTVGGSRRGWILLISKNGQDTWLPTDAIGAQSAGLVPEFEFVRAASAFLQFSATGSDRSARIATDAVRRFKKQYADAGQAIPVLPSAIGDIISGTLKQVGADQRAGVAAECSLRSAGGHIGVSGLDAALDDEAPRVDFKSAVTRMPQDSDVLTLSALGRIYALCGRPPAPQELEEITLALENARQIDSANPANVANLANWYRLLGTLDATILPASARNPNARADQLQRLLISP